MPRCHLYMTHIRDSHTDSTNGNCDAVAYSRRTDDADSGTCRRECDARSGESEQERRTLKGAGEVERRGSFTVREP